ncbi:hypothetical protein AGABI1DRAFT_127395 [Agaricus bisporus var. burnettii JB137-S8]|uniref:DUF6533 domain-containing protein n=1 Tax=Agaricus bisporus var. burnettii (strain JB137-S8 / ATCC MYA-4627 / FGSC 10392) TaxID=597362 RepID=K5Y0T2_AGABU|nr:uncharacterized protein AGABI1DRAFT_127395 [Agaricus bisporus var. burnettii JB137-S8]EKM81390.1 hypothetical protein AGABI1DRAFT_127395 [Agaricus bisporus var. burnettii JB137-S8]
MADASNLLIAKAADGLQTSRIINYALMASVVIVYYDWLLTFDSEVKLIWNAKGVKIKLLYLPARYLPLAHSLPYLYYRFGSPTASECTAMYQAIGTMFVVGVTCAALVVTLRTWAVWGMMRPMTYLLFGSYTVASVLILVFYIVSLKYTSPVSAANVALLFNQGDSGLYMLSIQAAIRSISACRIILHVRIQLNELQVRALPKARNGPTGHFERVLVNVDQDFKAHSSPTFHALSPTLSFLNTVHTAKDLSDPRVG